MFGPSLIRGRGEVEAVVEDKGIPDTGFTSSLGVRGDGDEGIDGGGSGSIAILTCGTEEDLVGKLGGEEGSRAVATTYPPYIPLPCSYLC